VALVGACLMVAGGALPLAKAYKAVDLDTLTLLLGMMIVVPISAPPASSHRRAAG
jgi:Na+/H+ antiporter NhaD/arsenite permease-like protein